MPPTNDFLPFCPTNTGTNLESQGNYLVDPDRTIGNQPGVASSQLVNKALRQPTYIASQVAQYISNQLAVDVLDDNTPAKLLSQIMGTFQPLAPVLTQYLSGTGTWNKTFIFFIASGNATAGATYTNNAITYTVVNTVTAGIVLQATGSGAPTANGGALTKASGTGDATITFYAYRSALYLRVRMVGAGAGAGGSSTNIGTGNGGAGGDGTDSTFGTSLLTAGGGFGGPGGDATPPGAPGTASLGVGPIGIALSGSWGDPSGGITAANFTPGGSGGASAFGGAGGGTGNAGASGNDASPNTGSGGGGAGAHGSSSSSWGGPGGGSGAFIDALIYSPNASYTYSVGVGGTGGTAGSSGNNGGSGADGLIEVTEIFQ